jgi:four helix bundle protein
MIGKEDLKQRTQSLAVEIGRLVNQLPRSAAGDVLGRQVLRSATSVGANYRAACRAQSTPVFLSKLATVIEESDETQYWLELLFQLGVCPGNRVSWLSMSQWIILYRLESILWGLIRWPRLHSGVRWTAGRAS